MNPKTSVFKKISLSVLGLAALAYIIAASLPANILVSGDAKIKKARQDCETLVQCVTRYESREKAAIKSLMDLHGKYITNIDYLKDPWNNDYQLDTLKKTVFSKGPDGIANNDDDIVLKYSGEQK